MVKNFSYITNERVDALYLTINKINGYIDEGNENNYLTLVPSSY